MKHCKRRSHRTSLSESPATQSSILRPFLSTILAAFSEANNEVKSNSATSSSPLKQIPKFYLICKKELQEKLTCRFSRMLVEELLRWRNRLPRLCISSMLLCQYLKARGAALGHYSPVRVWMCVKKRKKDSRGWFRSIDLWVMGPARSHCATLLACSLAPLCLLAL